MKLSQDLIKKFVKVTNDSKFKKVSETIAYGKMIQNGDKLFVKLDGATELTPVEQAMEAKADHRVVVSIKNHTATITGNVSEPANNLTEEVEGITQTISSLETDMSTTFQQLANTFILRLDASGRLALFQLLNDKDTGTQILLKADNIKLEGYTSINNEFQILPSGRLLAKNANFEGTMWVLGSTSNISLNEGIIQVGNKSNPSKYSMITENYIIGSNIMINFQSGAITCLSMSINNATPITSANIGSQSVNYASSAGTATKATNATTADSALQAGSSGNTNNVNNGGWLGQFQVSSLGGYISFGGYGSDGYHSYIGASTVSAPTVNYSSHGSYSLRSIKENIEPFTECATDIICGSHIRIYNFKDRANLGDKKRVGLIVDEAPDIVITKDNNAIDDYVMCSISWKAIQEQQEIINNQSDKILELESRLSDIESLLGIKKVSIFRRIINIFKNKKRG